MRGGSPGPLVNAAMIEIKIACQCGVPFRYGLELVNGQAPEGVGCPTCSATITPACNTLVDFLAGRNPAPSTEGTRVLKDIKVLCPCGARYKFEFELAEAVMPTPVACPACQADLTELANQEIKKFPDRFAVELPLAAAAAPAPVAPRTSPKATVNAASADVLAPAAAAPVSAEIALPALTPGPNPEAATSAPAITPPATPPAPEKPATPPVAPLFPPLDTSGPPPPKGMPNLKPLEVPRMERPVRPAGTKPPAAAGATATSGSKPGQPKPDTSPAAKADPKAAAKPAAKPVAKSSAPAQLNFPLGAAGAVVGAALGAGAWFAVLKTTTFGGGWMALLVGVLAGFGARLLGRGTSQALGGVACLAALLATGLMTWAALVHHINRLATPFLKGRYDSVLAEAKAVAEAKSDIDLKRIIARSVPNADPGMLMVTEADMKFFRETRLPFLRDVSAGKVSKEKFESQELAKYRSNYPLDEAWGDSLGIVGLLCALAGIIGAAKIAFKAS